MVNKKRFSKIECDVNVLINEVFEEFHDRLSRRLSTSESTLAKIIDLVRMLVRLLEDFHLTIGTPDGIETLVNDYRKCRRKFMGIKYDMRRDERQ